MNAKNRTTIAATVNAAFRLNVADKIAEINHTPYVVGTFANFDYSIAVSMMWDVRTRLLSLMPGNVTSADVPREGTYAAERNEHPDHRDRMVERKNAEFAHSVLSRVEEHLAEKAKDELAKVQGEDITPTKFYEFKPYMSTKAAFSEDRRVWALANLDKKGQEIQIAKLDEFDRLDEADFEGAGIGINDALDVFNKMVKEGDNLDRVAFNAWSKLRSNLVAYEDGFQKFEEARAFINTLNGDEGYYSSTMSKFAKINAEWNTKAFKLSRAIENNLTATPLLAHLGAPKDLINSPEWLTMLTEVETAKIEKDAMLLEAQIRQVKAKQRQVEVAKRMAALQTEMDDILDPKAAAKRKAKAERKAAAKAVAKATPIHSVPPVSTSEPAPNGTKPNGSGVRITNNSGIPSYSHR